MSWAQVDEVVSQQPVAVLPVVDSVYISAINSYRASHDNWCTVGGDGGCRIGKVRADTTSPMPDHKGFKLQ